MTKPRRKKSEEPVFPPIPMFIPNELEIEGRPELRVFPASVLFAKFGVREGREVIGSALYEPDLTSFESAGKYRSLAYRNKYGGDCRLRIIYKTEAEAWEGEKVINGQMVGCASGPSWQGFFAQFTLLGLANGERCFMEPLPPTAGAAQ